MRFIRLSAFLMLAAIAPSWDEVPERVIGHAARKLPPSSAKKKTQSSAAACAALFPETSPDPAGPPAPLPAGFYRALNHKKSGLHDLPYFIVSPSGKLLQVLNDSVRFQLSEDPLAEARGRVARNGTCVFTPDPASHVPYLGDRLGDEEIAKLPKEIILVARLATAVAALDLALVREGARAHLFLNKDAPRASGAQDALARALLQDPQALLLFLRQNDIRGIAFADESILSTPRLRDGLLVFGPAVEGDVLAVLRRIRAGDLAYLGG